MDPEASAAADADAEHNGERERRTDEIRNEDEEEQDEDEDEEENFDEMPDFSDDEEFEDDIDDDDLMPDLMQVMPKESDGVDSVVVVDGVPVVGAERVEKLKSVIRKIFAKFGSVVNEHYPLDEENKSKGYIFLEYSNHANAVEAVKMLSNYKLDKQHTFTVNLFSDFDLYLNIPDEWEPPTEEEYKDQGNLKSWLLETEANDQFSLVYEGERSTVAILSNTKPEPLELQCRQRWTETYVRWSPLGTYMVTFHGRGIALWGGQDFTKVRYLTR
jgi:translation initiation factor 3 subunit B